MLWPHEAYTICGTGYSKDVLFPFAVSYVQLCKSIRHDLDRWEHPCCAIMLFLTRDPIRIRQKGLIATTNRQSCWETVFHGKEQCGGLRGCKWFQFSSFLMKFCHPLPFSLPQMGIPEYGQQWVWKSIKCVKKRDRGTKKPVWTSFRGTGRFFYSSGTEEGNILMSSA